MVKVSKLGLASSVLALLTVLVGFGLASARVVAGDDNLNIVGGDIACTLSYTAGDGYSVTLQNGLYQADIGNSTLSAVCNDESGLAFYAVGYSGDEYGNNKMIATINGVSNSEYDITTSAATSGDDSAWAMKVSAVAGAYAPTIDNEFGSYRAVPDDYERIAYYNSATDDTVGSTIQLSYAIFASGSQPAGSYSGKVKYTLVHPAGERPQHPVACVEDKICYNANSNLAVGAMGKQSASASTEKALLAPNFSREGYGFAGWNTKYDYSGTTYGPNEVITTPSDMSEGLSLYAVWVKSAGNIQGWTGCSGMNVGDVTALTDQRDNETYAVAKLVDDKCWMIENLRLEAEDTRSAEDKALAQGYGTSDTYGDFIGLADAEGNWRADLSAANSLYSIDGSNGTVNIGSEDAGYRFPRYNNTNTPVDLADRPQNPTNGASINNNTNAGMYSYGNYYTWAAAIADTSPHETRDTSATTSLCPVGWRLPMGGTKANEANNDFWALVVTGLYGGVVPEDYDSNTKPYYHNEQEGADASKLVRTFPTNFLFSGLVDDGGDITGRGSYGSYWTSTTQSDWASDYLSYTSSYLYPGTNATNKYYGRTIRCIASLSSYSVTYDENTTDTVSNMPDVNPLTDTVDFVVGSVTLSDAVPTRRGFVFKGWCDEATDDGTCAGNVYNPDGNGTDLQFPINLNVSDIYTIYAMWGIPPDPCAGITSTKLYDLVACRNKGTQTLEDLAEDLTVPTTSNAAADLSTSGVYKYDASVFGVASDANNDYDIYYYRGILDSNMDGTASTYGSAGDGAYYPNYVILDEDGTKDTSDTCWRIVRTTGSGGIKMIYNGVWNGTSCANVGDDTQVTKINFNSNTNISRYSLLSAGYTFNSAYKDTTSSTRYSTLFGSNTNYSGNSTDSTVKDYIENTWFSEIEDYGGMLETSAGYCNDRTLYTEPTNSDPLGDNDMVEHPFHESGDTTTYHFGGAVRGRWSMKPVSSKITLGCYRDKADLYTVSGAATGNGQMAKPAALLTADEMAFAGSGVYLNELHYGYSYDSYLRTGSEYFSLTPADMNGAIRMLVLDIVGPNYHPISIDAGIRPVISFKNYTTVGSGSGTATDPWVVDLIYTMQSVSAWGSSLSIGDEVQAVDERDGKTYYVARLADGNIWMTQNLDHDIVTTPNFYTYENTDIGHGANPNVNAKWTAPEATHVAGDMTFADSYTTPESYDPGDKIWDGTLDFYGLDIDTMPQGTDPHYHLGNYYNWTAAVAMSDSSSYSTDGVSVDQSICPAGWTLPKGGNNNASGSFKYLVDSNGYNPSYPSMEDPTAWDAPLYFILGGGRYEEFEFIGGIGFYWSSTVDDLRNAYNFSVDDGHTIYEGSTGDRDYESSIRCIAR